MFHVNGWGSPVLLHCKWSYTYLFKKIDTGIHFKALQEHKVSILHMAPTVLNALLLYHDQHHPVIKQDIRVVIAGSAPPPAFIVRVEEELGWEFIQVYGMTESSPLSLISTIHSHLTGYSQKMNRQN